MTAFPEPVLTTLRARPALSYLYRLERTIGLLDKAPAAAMIIRRFVANGRLAQVGQGGRRGGRPLDIDTLAYSLSKQARDPIPDNLTGQAVGLW